MSDDIKAKLKAKKEGAKVQGSTTGKRGALSKPEMEYIKEHANILDVKEMSAQIGKSVETIRKFGYKANIVLKDKDGQDGDIKFVRLRKLLRSREYWTESTKMFSPDEIKIYENLWISLFSQFDEDVLPTEELQITKHIGLEISKRRFQEKFYTIEKQLQQNLKTLEEEYAKDAATKNIEAISSLTIMMDKLQNNQIALNKEINAIVDRQKDTEKALRGSRDQRIKEHIDAEKNWVNVVRILDNAEVREQVGKHIEIMKAAQMAQEYKLYDYHTFADQTLDRLILNSDSVSQDEDKKEENKNE